MEREIRRVIVPAERASFSLNIFKKEEKFIGDSFYSKKKKKKEKEKEKEENSHPHFASNGHYYKVYTHTQIALL